MAGSNHELTVNLKANVDPGYVAAFQNASAKAGELRGQMDALQATARNISSYERQQAAVEATKEKLDLLNAAQTSALLAETGSAAQAAGTAYLSAALPDGEWGDSYTFAPVLQIEVKGNADESTVRQTWSGIERELDRWWKQKTLQQRRMSFA